MPLTLESTAGILPRGGTILGTSRTNPFKDDGGPEQVLATLERHGIDALIPIGGEDTLGVARRLHVEHGVPVVGVPKTIDNDLDGTDFTFGFQTAVQIATDAIDRLHTTAESHNRVIIVEVMGRHAGWIAVYAGMAGGADAILVPERPFDIEEVCDHLRRRHDSGRNFSIVVVSEGAVPGRRRRPVEHRPDRRLRPRPPGRDRRAAGGPDRGAHRLREPHDHPRPRPARRHARPPTTACWPPASAWPPPTRWPTATSARWWPCAAPRSSGCRSTRRWPSPSCVDPELYETAEVFFG